MGYMDTQTTERVTRFQRMTTHQLVNFLGAVVEDLEAEGFQVDADLVNEAIRRLTK
jgi:hypothetical protein